MLSEVSNESEEVMVIQLLLHISAYTFVHLNEVTKTMYSNWPLQRALKPGPRLELFLWKNEKFQ